MEPEKSGTPKKEAGTSSKKIAESKSGTLYKTTAVVQEQHSTSLSSTELPSPLSQVTIPIPGYQVSFGVNSSTVVFEESFPTVFLMFGFFCRDEVPVAHHLSAGARWHDCGRCRLPEGIYVAEQQVRQQTPSSR